MITLAEFANFMIGLLIGLGIVVIAIVLSVIIVGGAIKLLDKLF